MKCFCCRKDIEVNAENDNPMVLKPAYGGLWFRAYGNFGSTIFDPIIQKLSGKEEFIQILICDECVKAKQLTDAGSVTYVHNIHSVSVADSEPFKPEG